MTDFVNYIVPSKKSKLTQGHIKAEDLHDLILKHNGSEAYCCYFDLDKSSIKNEIDTGEYDDEGGKIYRYDFDNNYPKTFAKFEGLAKASLNYISFDFDSDDINESFDDVKDLIDYFDFKYYRLFFSGGKGFHLMLPTNYFPFEKVSESLPNQIKNLVKYLKETYKTIDDSIYNYNRKFRLPFSKHDKTGLYKNLISVEMEVDEILEYCKKREPQEIENNFSVEVNQDICEIVDQCKRFSYEVEKDKGGSLDKPSPFEKFDGKLCIQKMVESRCDDIGRNNACLRIVNDFYRTQKPQNECEKVVGLWASNNGLPLSEVSGIINNIYNGNANYNFGCQDDCKSSYCSAKCPIWKKLDPDKRPVTVDMPVSSETSTSLRNEFSGVTWLMRNIFGCDYDEDKGIFTDGVIVKQDATHLFYYKDKHWQYLDEAKVHVLKTKLNQQYDNKLSTRKLDAVFKMFILYVPEVPEEVNLFAPRNDMANFLDGTLHLERNKFGEFELVFKDHNKHDFCPTMIELNYKDYVLNPDVKNSMFEDWLFEYLGEDQESFNLIQEMFGASLLPKFAQFFVLIGKSGTGKSTTIKVLKQLHKNDKNICGVSPDKFHGFHMASMIGKLINIVNDIKTNCRIDDDIVKQVDDQDEVRIEIKGKADVYTKLPALHIFGANKMPSTSEGYSGAMKRRFSIINFDKQYEGKQNHEIAKDMFNDSPIGILAFALRGLERLICKNNGEYTKTTKSQVNVDKWSKKSDIVWSFINSVIEEPLEVDGELMPIKLDEEGKISRSKIWKMFYCWQQTFLDTKNQIGKMNFLNMLNDAGFESKKTNKFYVICGISEEVGEDTNI